MQMNKNEGLFEQICNIIKKFAPCMNDYLYACDIKEDTYYISETALERFALPSNCFHQVVERHKDFVYKDDISMLEEDLNKLIRGEKKSHNIKYRWIGKDGEPIWINCKGLIYPDEDGSVRYLLGCINEIGAKQIADNVSNLLGEEELKNQIIKYQGENKKGFLLRVGIDDFKDINERFGTDYGDSVLRDLADCMKRAASEGEMIYRIVSDEFAVLDVQGGTAKDAEEVYDKICRELEQVVEQSNYKCVYTISAGIITNEDIAYRDYKDIMKLSQFTLSQAKKQGKNQVCAFKEEDYENFLRKREILRTMRQAVSNNFDGFELYFQPIMDAKTEEIYAAETLLRFHMSETEMISPGEFIPILEDSGLIIPVGKWVLKNALQTCRDCRKVIPDFKISINLSYIQILKSQILDEIIGDVSGINLDSSSVIIELTESGYLENSIVIQTLWNRLKEYGICIALDDFGTGYSNLQNIGEMTPNIVKLDRGFTVKALKKSYEKQLMIYIIKMVHSIGLKICVEGVETAEELEDIQKMEPDYIQGYYYGRPCPKEEFFDKYINNCENGLTDGK